MQRLTTTTTDGPPNAFFNRQFRDANGVATAVFANRGNVPTICSGDNVAETYDPAFFSQNLAAQQFVQIVLCPHAFDPTFFRQTTTGADAPPGEATKSGYEYLAGAFVHELFHLLGGQCEAFTLSALPNSRSANTAIA